MPHSAFRTAVEAGDLDGMRAALAEDVTFSSPAVFKAYEGRDTVMQLLGFVFTVFEDFRYVGELRDGDQELLRFRAHVGDKQLEGIDLIRENEAGEVAELTVMIRPLSGLTALQGAMGEKLKAAGAA